MAPINQHYTSLQSNLATSGYYSHIAHTETMMTAEGLGFIDDLFQKKTFKTFYFVVALLSCHKKTSPGL